MNKVEDILSIKDLNLYKDQHYDLKKLKTVHIDNSYVTLLFGGDNIAYFEDYVSHDGVYNYDKKQWISINT